MPKLELTALLVIFTVAIHAGTYQLTNVSAIDGDTIRADIHLGFSITLTNQSIRLAGIDTPETHTRIPLEKRAGLIVTLWLTGTIAHGSVFTLTTNGKERGKFGRPLGVLTIDKRNICDILIEKGFARVYNGGKKLPWTDKQLNLIIQGGLKCRRTGDPGNKIKWPENQFNN